jgi:hypothetical protein
MKLATLRHWGSYLRQQVSYVRLLHRQKALAIMLTVTVPGVALVAMASWLSWEFLSMTPPPQGQAYLVGVGTIVAMVVMACAWLVALFQSQCRLFRRANPQVCQEWQDHWQARRRAFDEKAALMEGMVRPDPMSVRARARL